MNMTKTGNRNYGEEYRRQYYYYGARYLDPRTSRWLSSDPALGEYIPGAPVNDEVKKQNGNLPGMGGVFNTLNLHAFHYAGNNPVKYVDPDGRVVLDEATIDTAEANLQQQIMPHELGSLVNTRNLARNIVRGRNNLDSETRDYVGQLGRTNTQRIRELKKLLDNVKVYEGVGGDLDAALSQFAPGMPQGLDGLTIGNNIYLKDGLGAMNRDTAMLLGHEAIHSIQAEAYGGKTNFINEYLTELDVNGYSGNNKFELAAYKFGADFNPSEFPSIKPSQQRLKLWWWRP